LLSLLFQGLAMPSSDAFALRRSGLNEFLFASVGTEPNGMALSVLSVFARLGDDPWKEAGKLVGLPKGEAIKSLAQAISGMPRSVWTFRDATMIATRLVALLPTRLGNAAPEPSNVRERTARTVRVSLLLAGFAFGMALALGLFTTHPASKFDGSDISTMSPAAAPAPPTD
jgi:hypothetical protein